MVKVRRSAVPQSNDVVPAQFRSLIVQRLSDVSKEVDQELEGLLPVCGRCAGILNSGGLARILVNHLFFRESKEIKEQK